MTSYSKAQLKERLAGKNTPQTLYQEMMRVNHAGETAAVTIYEGQKKTVSVGSEAWHSFEHMKQQEQVHLTYFEKLLAEKHIRPSVLGFLWAKAGYLLGYSTAKASVTQAMICTQAVETAIGDHYQEQITYLKGKILEGDREILQKFCDEELEHKEHATDFIQNKNVSSWLKNIIQTGCHMAIKIAEKI